ncbi:MAG: hypothetical protein A3C27_01125 [Candidatus Levybacteria bacterium RIFCSPHIGHO2_02_FULL_39_36]|nr:MAG: hypothetical protein A2689_01775 [Candidatus Levybacteria bacterium RIFCSPHIGHO2_01_FULL_38_96]OGH25457.1 MAG: hypothetical protein A3E68_01120 [Candidatus Levybacteria bacterium RIFCSPHIGHO2_12_FULL_39_39]OGH28415.1 MAG: hypothetical protein A3C27_01125 [Candidatus Levybacteria bacterium RIFCSPHIGHO2_02_FULL_39_36]OGH36097.1 MAG: hypothetical protein A3B43_02675 [Candidatus Levybacteria bacterium RIFCSPLOWO2_01_FULL_38_120]OGH45708.1 MAG: hypothetical protein A3H82_03490 [Candidatus Le
MSKKRRTRKEKMMALTRRSYTPLASINQLEPEKLSPRIPEMINLPHGYSYVGKDLRKTIIVTSIITVFNFILYLLLKSGTIRFFNIQF